MKTSNKLLFSAGAGLIMGFIVFLFSVKANMIQKGNNSIPGNGIKEVRIVIDNLTLEEFYLSNDFSYILDPNSKEVSISGDQNIIDAIEIEETETALHIYKKNGLHFTDHLPVEVFIGIADKNSIKIEIDDDAKLTSKDSLQLTSLTLQMNDDAVANLFIDADILDVNLYADSDLTLSGEADIVSTKIFSYRPFNGKNLKSKTVKLDMGHDSNFYLQNATLVTGNLKNSATLLFGGDMRNVKVNLRDNAQVKVHKEIHNHVDIHVVDEEH